MATSLLSATCSAQINFPHSAAAQMPNGQMPNDPTTSNFLAWQ